MSLTNRVSLIGFLGKDAEVKTNRNNARFTVLSLATKRSWKDRETGEWQSKSTWHRIICWGRLTPLLRQSWSTPNSILAISWRSIERRFEVCTTAFTAPIA
jgi:single stranded DNA-binding protein